MKKKDNKKQSNDIKVKKFIDKNFGEEIEYCLIKDRYYKILVYGKHNKMIIFRIKNIDHLIQELIMLKEERDFLIKENEELLIDLENKRNIKVHKS